METKLIQRRLSAYFFWAENSKKSGGLSCGLIFLYLAAASRSTRNSYKFNGKAAVFFYYFKKARQLLACHQPRTQFNCPNYPSPSSSSKNISLVNSAGKETAWNQETDMNSVREEMEEDLERAEEDAMELHLVQPDDVGVLEQLQRGDLPLYLRRAGHPSTRTVIELG